ncbi:hypothetical protein SCNU_02235 [Gordonia neofelifaecis NRRL B-59395]|uniref:Transmembrane protein n=1 Tax=Gordonia neofelifaecis NRRL B-59395 TaxID=644548 RepID=F1YE65_9ACTN|nr:hypothetical protein SCNU_02235 [Gordonia neofelifaecis NRRL B-59395]
MNVHIQTGTTEVLRIAATLLLFGGAGAIAWTVAQGPNAEMAASGLSMMIVMMIKLSYARGRIAIPKSGGDTDDFAATKGVVTQIAGEYTAWMAKASMPVMALIAAAYAVAFLVLRAGVAAALGVFSNLYIAAGSAAMIGALVVFPSLVPNMIRGLKDKGVVTDAPAATAQPVVQAPVAPAPIAPPVAETPAPVPTASQPVKKVVVKKVVKKESNDA